MATYLIFKTVNNTLDNIWQYSNDKWGERQADKYINKLHDHLQALADKEKFWHCLPSNLVIPKDLDIKSYYSKYEHHHIFFRELSDNKIGIMSILHENMNMPVRLTKDLNKIINTNN